MKKLSKKNYNLQCLNLVKRNQDAIQEMEVYNNLNKDNKKIIKLKEDYNNRNQSIIQEISKN